MTATVFDSPPLGVSRAPRLLRIGAASWDGVCSAVARHLVSRRSGPGRGQPASAESRWRVSPRLTTVRLKLARDVCHGKRGTIHQAYRDGVEDQLGSLSLVLNTIVDDPLRRRRRGPSYRAEGHAIREEDITRLSPLQAPQPEPARPLQLHRLDPGRRRPAPAERRGRARAGRGRRRRGLNAHIG
ncbi:Tn3 family transposase [Nonomuraea sp. NPDC049269]|uniref:Tn3 family transposase n=1 Tax=Nonomuraea sp. NPDC049269 TaxID=3364349 RepID=UPI00371253B4